MGQKAERCAAATSDGLLVDQHFGRAKAFEIYDIASDGSFEFVESRSVPRACRGEEGHDDAALLEAADLLSDCAFVIVARVGPAAWAQLEHRGIASYSLVAEVDTAIEKVVRFRRMQAEIEEMRERV